jgi:hypothetical protein
MDWRKHFQTVIRWFCCLWEQQREGHEFVTMPTHNEPLLVQKLAQLWARPFNGSVKEAVEAGEGSSKAEGLPSQPSKPHASAFYITPKTLL